MRIRILGETNTAAYSEAVKLIKELGHEQCGCNDACDIAIAPLLMTILKEHEINRPRLGTLIFHPSPLPHGRGARSIRMAYERREPITAATWFWANSGIDQGDICEQEIVKIDYSTRPRQFYERDVIPAMVRTLRRALQDIDKGITRRVPQVEAFASYD